MFNDFTKLSQITHKAQPFFKKAFLLGLFCCGFFWILTFFNFHGSLRIEKQHFNLNTSFYELQFP
ncbi:hypothetical protein CMV16_22020 [Peribacillus simplex]|nr:hypothetical protein CMV16_22020 [Peribacillus simplex]